MSGCPLNAQLGAIERLFAPLADSPGACCLITGGAAPRLCRICACRCATKESLILTGLVRYANSLGADA